MKRLTFVSVVVLIFLGGCSSGATSTPTPASTPAPSAALTPAPTPAPTAPPTAAPTPAPTAAPSPTQAATAPDISTFTGAPGTFSWNGFQVVTVSVGEGWRAADSADDYFALIRGSGDTSTGAVTVNTFGGTTYGNPCTGPGTETKGGSQSVDAFFSYLSSIDALTVSAPEPVTIDGLSGESATIAANGCDGRIWLWQTPITGDFHFVNGEAAKIWAVDNAGTTVVITAEGFNGTGDLNEMLPSVEAMVSSMTIAH